VQEAHCEEGSLGGGVEMQRVPGDKEDKVFKKEGGRKGLREHKSRGKLIENTLFAYMDFHMKNSPLYY
jgi:hypothetical protein